MALQFLDATTISMGEIFLTVLSERLADTGDIWGEKPRLHINGITFRRRESDKLVVPIVETFVILGGLYKNGNYYKVNPFGEMPGKYDYQHKLCFYSLNPTTYRKICEQRIRDALSEIILHQRDYLPERMCGVTVQQTSVAHEVSLQTTGHNAHSMLVVITPAIEGAGIPEGVREPVLRHVEMQRFHPTWLLVPCSRRPNELQSWNITFQPLEAALLQRSAILQQTVLFLTWFAEKRGWGERGLPTSHVFTSIATIQLHVSNGTFAAERFTIQVKVMLTQLRSYLQAKRLEDFFVLKKNLLEPLSIDNLESIQSEVDDVLQNMMQTSTAVDEYIRSNYPYYITRGDDEELSSSTENLVVQEILEKNVSLPLPEAYEEEELQREQVIEDYRGQRVIVEEPIEDNIPVSESITTETLSATISSISVRESISIKESSSMKESVTDETNEIEAEDDSVKEETMNEPLVNTEMSTDPVNEPLVDMEVSSGPIVVEETYKEEMFERKPEPITPAQKESVTKILTLEQIVQEATKESINYSEDSVNNNTMSKDVDNMTNEKAIVENPAFISPKSTPSKASELTNAAKGHSVKDPAFVSNGSATIMNGRVNSNHEIIVASIDPVVAAPLAAVAVGDASSPSTSVMDFMGNFHQAFVYSILAFVVVSLGIVWMMSTDIDSMMSTLIQGESNANASEKEL